MTTSKDSDARFVNFIRGESHINPEVSKRDISWVQFIAALLLIPVFVISGILFTVVDIFGANRRAGAIKGSGDPDS